ncbi:MAG: hypothetical protein ACM3X5_09675, partial [Bacillota bacterium]
MIHRFDNANEKAMNPFDKTDDPRRRLLIQMLAAGAFSLESASALAQIFGSRPEKLPPGRSIYRLQGQVQVDGQSATLQTPVTPTSTIETGKDAEIVFVQGQTSYIQRGNSRVVLERPSEPQSGFAAGLRLIAGALLSVFPKGTPQQLRTKTATVGIRGTGVYLEADPEQTYFCTCYGVADVVANDDPESKDTVAATHHNRPLYIVSGAQK